MIWRSLVVPLFSSFMFTSTAVTLNEFLFEYQSPPRLSKSISLANKEKNRILSLISEVDGLALVLPTDAAWNSSPGIFEALYRSNQSDLVQDVILSTVAEMKTTESSSWESVKEYAAENEVIGTVYGASFILGNKRGSICTANWYNGHYQSTSRCIELELPPIVLEDATIYVSNGVLLPDDLLHKLGRLI